MDNITKTEMAKLGIDVADPSQPIGTMSGGQRQTLQYYLKSYLFWSKGINFR